MAVFRCYAEKRPGFDVEAQRLLAELQSLFSLKGLHNLRYLCRYDMEGIDASTYERAKSIVFSEPMADDCYDEIFPLPKGDYRMLLVESLPGQFDQRANSCAECVQLLTQGERPIVSVARVYLLEGTLSDDEFDKVRSFFINPVDTREATPEKPQSLQSHYPAPAPVQSLDGFLQMDEHALGKLLGELGLAMDLDDLRFLQAYFQEEHRNPTITEIRVIDTYWSDHCRHTTFLTHIDSVQIEDASVQQAFARYLQARQEVYGEKAENRPITLMDVATIGAKVLKKRGLLQNLDESEEINACSIRVEAEIDGKKEPWLLMFKNETHNHPTEIEPFGGAATCLGGAIRDPLSGRSYVYQAMRVTGAGDPRASVQETMQGKLPQRTLCQTAAAGYSSYGNQIGLATGLVHEIYHPGYIAKRMEIGAVVGAVPAEQVRREVPQTGDVVILLGGKTGRDGCGGATGSSKSHTSDSLSTCGAEVQKGNPPEERKLQRLFRKPEVTKLIRRCNDFGAGGVSVAIGELAEGLDIDLDAVPKKYEGLDGTELAISESQERMAVVVAKEDAQTFIAYARAENLQAVQVATVTNHKRLRMFWQGNKIVDLARAFLDTNGSTKHVQATIKAQKQPIFLCKAEGNTLKEQWLAHLATLGICLEQGLVERFDSSIGASSVLMPFGGKTQKTPTQVMAATLPAEHGVCSTASVMAFGFDPYISEENPFLGASYAVLESVAKLVAAGCDYQNAYLTLQEYFERLGQDPQKFGLPFAALLGAWTAQEALGIAAIGGKDSMSGTYQDLHVPPTLVSFAIAPAPAQAIVSPEFKGAGHYVYCYDAPLDEQGAPQYPAIGHLWQEVHDHMQAGKIVSAWALSAGGIGEAIAKMTLGNAIGFTFDESFPQEALFFKNYGGILVESLEPLPALWLVGKTTKTPTIEMGGVELSLAEVQSALEAPLASVFPMQAQNTPKEVPPPLSYTHRKTHAPAVKQAKPKVLIPVFPGTNCEYDTVKAVEQAGGQSEIFVVRNHSHEELAWSVEELQKRIQEAQMLILPGGFSGGDEPDGSGKFIASFLRAPALKQAIYELLYQRDGLMLGICNGFQALIKLGLVPYGEIRDLTQNDPTLTFNLIGRHQSRYVTTRVASVQSPWLSSLSVGDLHTIAVSHGEGRFVADATMLEHLAQNGQIAFQYTDAEGNPSMDIAHNPNGSVWAIEGITSPDGRVLGKMGHTERYSPFVAKNIIGEKYQPIFENGVRYFK